MIFATVLLAVALSREPLESALAKAKAAWGVEAATEIAWQPLNDCKFRIGAHPEIAETQWITTRTFSDDGGVIDESQSARIVVNSNCDWSRQPLAKAVIHEYGHVLGVAHSSDPGSIMFWIVYANRRQSITAADRAQISSGQHE